MKYEEIIIEGERRQLKERSTLRFRRE